MATELRAGIHHTTKSINDDFAACVKDIYRIVQLKHHETNWEELPKSLVQRLERFAGDISLPMVTKSCGRRWKSSQTPTRTRYARLPAK